jgi:bacillithiol biosynthesis cysteine-adding enzyme BshC
MNLTLNTSLYNSLYYDYLAQNSKALQFLSNFMQVDWKQLANEVLVSSDRYTKVKKIMAKQNSDPKAIMAEKNLKKLSSPNSVFIITGQQLGLFTSPIYTVYKVITTIKLAAQLNKQKLPFYFIPVFWLESEDHDYEEVNHFGIFDRNFLPKQLMYEGFEAKKASVRHHTLTKQIQVLFSDLSEGLMETEFTDPLFNKLRSIYKEGRNWVDATQEFMDDMFSEYGLLFFRPGDSDIKKLSTDFFIHILEHSTDITQNFSKISAELSQSGYLNQISDIAGKTYIHIEDDSQQRDHLLREENMFLLKGSEKTFTLSAIKKYLQDYPNKFSTTVVSRPLLQSWLMPTVVYVAGPAEIAYWAQLKSLFSYLKLTMPIVYPRISATLVEPKIARYLKKHNPDIENLPKRKDDFLAEYFKYAIEEAGTEYFKQIKKTLESGSNNLNTYLRNLDPTLMTFCEKTFERINHQLDNLEAKTTKALQHKEQVVANHLTQVHETFFPEQNPQERYISIIYYLNKFGPAFITRLMESLNINQNGNQIVFIE